MPPFKIGTLGEVAIRCINMHAMVAFYTDTIGLTVLSGSVDEGIVFFKLSDGFNGHTTILALFAYDRADLRAVHPQSDAPPISGGASTLHPFALSMNSSEQDKAIAWFESTGQKYKIETFSWIGWRGVFLEDPDGNTVELVSKNASISP